MKPDLHKFLIVIRIMCIFKAFILMLLIS